MEQRFDPLPTDEEMPERGLLAPGDTASYAGIARRQEYSLWAYCFKKNPSGKSHLYASSCEATSKNLAVIFFKKSLAQVFRFSPF